MRASRQGLIVGSMLIAVTARSAPSRRATSNPGSCPERMVRVPAGSFRMGSPEGVGEEEEHPAHDVTLSAYCIDSTEVTVKAYAACVAAGRCDTAHIEVSPFCNRDDRPDHPVTCVDWSQATTYCAWVGKRLPTEAEWEYAARGSDGRAYPWGDDAPSARLLNACGSECVAMGKRVLARSWRAMYDASDGWETTAPAGSFPAGASPFGVLDMAGNVWEWTADWFGDYGAAAATNPRGPKTGSARVNRGDGWHGHLASDVRAAIRSANAPELRSNSIGFRCARSLLHRSGSPTADEAGRRAPSRDTRSRP